MRKTAPLARSVFVILFPGVEGEGGISLPFQENGVPKKSLADCRPVKTYANEEVFSA